MALIAPDVMTSVERFLAVVRRRRLDAAYLYGSQVAGSAHPWSDIDIAVISPDFSKEQLFQERVTLMQWAAAIDDRIEPQPFPPERFDPNDPLASEISRKGVRLV